MQPWKGLGTWEGTVQQLPPLLSMSPAGFCAVPCPISPAGSDNDDWRKLVPSHGQKHPQLLDFSRFQEKQSARSLIAVERGAPCGTGQCPVHEQFFMADRVDPSTFKAVKAGVPEVSFWL